MKKTINLSMTDSIILTIQPEDYLGEKVLSEKDEKVQSEESEKAKVALTVWSVECFPGILTPLALSDKEDVANESYARREIPYEFKYVGDKIPDAHSETRITFRRFGKPYDLEPNATLICIVSIGKTGFFKALKGLVLY